jgi:hypothetical protein
VPADAVGGARFHSLAMERPGGKKISAPADQGLEGSPIAIWCDECARRIHRLLPSQVTIHGGTICDATGVRGKDSHDQPAAPRNRRHHPLSRGSRQSSRFRAAARARPRR